MADGAETGIQGFAPDLQERLDLGIRSGLLEQVHAVLVYRRGEQVLEAWYEGEDQDWGTPLGHVAFDGGTLHDVRSVTKGVTSLLYGIALEKGLVPGPDAPLMAQFPDHADLADDTARASWTIGHALNMTLGTEWNEDAPYDSDANSEIAMELAEDRYRFILGRPVVAEPGTRWTYCGGATALLGHIIAEGTGQSLADFAREHLFRPIGAGPFEWSGGKDMVLSAASGLRLTAPDLARIGHVVLNIGTWGGERIVPEAWLRACWEPQTTTAFGLGYSNQWYLSEQPVPAAGGTRKMISAMGNGGQRLYVIPSLGLVAVVFCGNYSKPDQWMTPTLILQKIILAGLREV